MRIYHIYFYIIVQCNLSVICNTFLIKCAKLKSMKCWKFNCTAFSGLTEHIYLYYKRNVMFIALRNNIYNTALKILSLNYWNLLGEKVNTESYGRIWMCLGQNIYKTQMKWVNISFLECQIEICLHTTFPNSIQLF